MRHAAAGFVGLIASLACQSAMAIATVYLTLTPSDADGNPLGTPVVTFADGLRPTSFPIAPPIFVPTTSNAVYQTRIAPSLALGQTLDLYWTYSAVMSTDGLAVQRSGDGCIRWYSFPRCVPQATGYEMAYVGVTVFSERRVPPGAATSSISDFDGLDFPVWGQPGVGAQVSWSGLVHLQLTGEASEVRTPSSYDLVAFVWVDSNPVAAIPEPATYALMSAGLVMLAGMARRRRAPSQDLRLSR